MATCKLYEQNAEQYRFDAVVTGCWQEKETADGWRITLDKTAFFPEGGGQPADHGTLGGRQVSDVHERDGEVIHYTNGPLEVGSHVEGCVDEQRRRDLTTQHSGEHIVSGLICSTYGYNNVGFHLGGEVITIDFDGELTAEQAAEIEQMANDYIREDKETEILLPTAEELDGIAYRSKKELSGQVRIVRFPGADTCACCGTHVRRAGQVRLVKLLSVQKFRSGCRIEMLAGERAIRYLDRMMEQNRQISRLLSAKPMETAAAVARLMDEAADLKAQIYALQEQQFDSIAKAHAGADKAVVMMDKLDAVAVRRLCVALMEQCSGMCAVFSGEDGAGYKYALGKAGSDIRSEVKAMNNALQGRGGGKDAFFAQGSVQASKEEILQYFA